MSRPRAVVLALIAAGAVCRLIGISDPPLDFHPTRQFRSAIIARSYVLDRLPISLEQRHAAEVAAGGMPLIEPPIMEHLAAVLYRVSGGERLWLPRALSVTAWCLGGLALFSLARQLLPADAAVVAPAVWLFLPFAIRASRSFQPDPLMISLTMAALAAGLLYMRRPRLAAGVLFACAVGGAVVVKAMAVFFLGPGLLAIVLASAAPWRVRVQAMAVAAVAAVPGAIYYAKLPLAMDYGPFPQLLRQPFFWRGWIVILERVVSLPLAVGVVIGVLGARGVMRWLLLGLVAGYLLFGFVFTYHIYTHDYYSLPLVPIAALAAGAIAERIQTAVRRLAPRGTVAALAVLMVVIYGGVETAQAVSPAPRMALRATAADYAAIGAMVHHSTHVWMLDGTYGFPLDYYGYLAGSNWPLSIDLVAAAATGSGAMKAPPPSKLTTDGEFFVATVQAELDAQPDVRQFLERRYSLVARKGAPDRWTYVLYDLRKPIFSLTPSAVSLFARIGGAAPEERVELFAPPDADWRLDVGPGPVHAEPRTGRGAATLRITADTPVAAGEQQVAVAVRAQGRTAATLDVHYRAVAGPDQPPFGTIDAPADPLSIAGDPVILMGWALDDILLARIVVEAVDSRGSVLPLGEADRGGRRPDVAAVYPTAHDAQNAAWAFRLDPARVRQMARPFRVRIFAEDSGGHRVPIGERHVR